MRLCLIVITTILNCAVSADVKLNTKYGSVVGFKKTYDEEFAMNVYLGVPFVNPLGREDRGKRSVAPEKWQGDWIAQTYKPACLQNIKGPNTFNSSEDCLYLNIFTPTECKSKYPIVVFIHGGGFVEGSAIEPDDFPLARNFVPKDIIVITIQYRLGVLGFPAITDATNLGLWDQTMALKFVKENAGYMCGDDSKITLLGHSAGSISVSLLTTSPFAAGLFQRSIQLSGSGWGMSAYKQLSIRSTENFFNQLNCTTNNMECLRAASPAQILSSQISGTFFPFMGDSIIPKAPQHLFPDQTPPMPAMISVMSAEYLYFTYLKANAALFPSIDKYVVEGQINTSVVTRFPVNKMTDVYKDSMNFFLPENRSDYAYFMEQNTYILSSLYMNTPIIREASERSTKANIYVYHFDYFNPAEFPDDFPTKSTYHCHEFPYIFGQYLDRTYDFDETDEHIQKMLLESLTSFVKTGIPTSEKIEWTTFDSNFTHIKISPEPTVEEDLFRPDYDFWKDMKKYGVDAITLDKVEDSSGSSILLPLLLSCTLILAL